jgi:hypothetical protein
MTGGGIDIIGLKLLPLLTFPILVPVPEPEPELTLPTAPGSEALAVLAFVVLFPELALLTDPEVGVVCIVSFTNFLGIDKGVVALFSIPYIIL